MEFESEWAARPDLDRLRKEKTLQSIKTAEITSDFFHRAPTEAIRATVKSPEDAVEEMRTWLRTGVAPDGTRMITAEALQWHQDYYQATSQYDVDHICLPEGAQVDYYYWTAPYLAHIGNMKFVMMHSQVNLPDGTHMPADRLRAETLQRKNLRLKAQKRVEVEQRQREALLREIMARTGGGRLERAEEY